MIDLEFSSFKSPLNQWSSETVYRRERDELYNQIDLLLSLQSGLGQSSQGYPENHEYRARLKEQCQLLKKSIAQALQIT